MIPAGVVPAGVTPLAALYAVWLGWAASWLVAGLWRGRAVAGIAPKGMRTTLAIVALGFAGLFAEPPWRVASLWRVPPPLGWAMVVLAIAGMAFA